ncbi:MAG: 4Fe-4S binding protein [Chloroherpetonaceae bacterium]|nr:4Fe-4S binding protein [Chloroherpetonaceae bacterium]
MEAHLAASTPTAPATTNAKKRLKIVWKRMAIQLTFIFVHVALIKFAIPNIVWAIIGLAFWGTLVVLAAKSGRWVCSTFCWLGGIQDLFYGLAKKRVDFNPKISQAIVLAILFVWVPIAWAFHSEAITDMTESPIHNPLRSTESFLVQAGHFLVLMSVGLSVTILGARGACHYLCPFGMVVQAFRNRRLRARAKNQ